MGPWEFVALAYGIVWGAIAIYAFNLKRRYKAAAAELARLDVEEARGSNEQR
jgi:CcmD family protein